jgi:hypothetical protein
VSLTDPFRALGLTRKTATEANVKAAYARLLKVTRPEDDRAAFMALRQAFESARVLARSQDRIRAEAAQTPGDAPVTDVVIADAAAPEPLSAAPQPVAKTFPQPDVLWSHDSDLDWSFNNSPQGKLTHETIRWMVDGGPEADRFAARISEALIAAPEIDGAAYREELINYLAVAADPEGRRHKLAVWMPVPATRPDWLRDETIRVLRDDLGLLRTGPTGSWSARAYNTVLEMFGPAPDAPDAGGSLPAPLNVETLFEREESEARKDTHGSFFDREKKAWVDMSPVAIAMRDLQAALDRNMWDLPQVCRAILARRGTGAGRIPGPRRTPAPADLRRDRMAKRCQASDLSCMAAPPDGAAAGQHLRLEPPVRAPCVAAPPI